MKLGRNDPCPCGSGAKAKRCCGVDAARRRAQISLEAAGELLELAQHFPRHRPATAAFDAWARTAPEVPSEEAIEAGVAALDAGERARIVDGFAREYPELWRGILADFGNDELAVEIVLKGAVVVGVLERLALPEGALELLESYGEVDPALALALVMSPGDLWSVIESGETAEVLDPVSEDLDEAAYDALWERTLQAECERRLTPWHEARLDLLLARVRERVPVEGYPRASQILLAAVEQLEADDRDRLATELLASSLERLWDADAPARLAA
jgi:hypothetical protein